MTNFAWAFASTLSNKSWFRVLQVWCTTSLKSPTTNRKSPQRTTSFMILISNSLRVSARSWALIKPAQTTSGSIRTMTKSINQMATLTNTKTKRPGNANSRRMNNRTSWRNSRSKASGNCKRYRRSPLLTSLSNQPSIFKSGRRSGKANQIKTRRLYLRS